MRVVGACGCICSECRLYNDSCKGCHSIKGKACWLHEVSLTICDFYECCVIDNKLKHCGQCEKIPCAKFWDNKNPKWSDEEHRKIVEERTKMLKELDN